MTSVRTAAKKTTYSEDISFAWLIVYDRLSKSISKNPSLMTHRSHTLLMHKKSLDVQIMKTYLFPQTHEESCEYGDAQCAACGETMERRHLKRHRENDCVNRAVACTYCGGQVRQSNMKVGK